MAKSPEDLQPAERILQGMQLLMFDWSGVISDDRPPVYEANMRLFDKFGLRRISMREWLTVSRQSAIELLHAQGVVTTSDEVFEAEGNLKQAELIYQKGLKTDIFGNLYTRYATLLVNGGNFKQAKEISSQGVIKFPQNSTLWIINAIASYKLGNRQEAMDNIQKAKSLSSDPNIDQVYEGIVNNNL